MIGIHHEGSLGRRYSAGSVRSEGGARLASFGGGRVAYGGAMVRGTAAGTRNRVRGRVSFYVSLDSRSTSDASPGARQCAKSAAAPFPLCHLLSAPGVRTSRARGDARAMRPAPVARAPLTPNPRFKLAARAD